MFDYPAEIRRLIYTTNTVEGYNRQLRKVVKTKGALPSGDAARKLLYLVTMGDHEEVDGADLQLGQDPQPVGDSVRGTVSDVGRRKAVYTNYWLSRNSRAHVQAAAKTRMRSRSKLPRPYIARRICFSLVTCPSATPLL